MAILFIAAFLAVGDANLAKISPELAAMAATFQICGALFGLLQYLKEGAAKAPASLTEDVTHDEDWHDVNDTIWVQLIIVPTLLTETHVNQPEKEQAQMTSINLDNLNAQIMNLDPNCDGFIRNDGRRDDRPTRTTDDNPDNTDDRGVDLSDYYTC